MTVGELKALIENLSDETMVVRFSNRSWIYFEAEIKMGRVKDTGDNLLGKDIYYPEYSINSGPTIDVVVIE